MERRGKLLCGGVPGVTLAESLTQGLTLAKTAYVAPTELGSFLLRCYKYAAPTVLAAAVILPRRSWSNGLCKK